MTIHAKIAQHFVSRLEAQLQTRVTVINNQGSVIAGGTYSPGSRHPKGAKLIEAHAAGKGASQGHVVSDTEVVMLLEHQREVFGAVEVSDTPDAVWNTACTVKTSLEILFAYESCREDVLRREDIRSQFLSQLLYEEGRGEQELVDFAGKLGYDEGITRVPVLIQLASADEACQVLEAVTGSQGFDSQHMGFITIDRDVLVFKPVCARRVSIFSSIRDEVSSFIDHVCQEIEQAGLQKPLCCSVGSCQSEFSLYREAYRHAVWVISRKRKEGYERGALYFFSDYVSRYFFEVIPRHYVSLVFGFTVPFIDRSTRKMLIETVEALRRSNMSIKDAAEYLDIHRNTISFRLDKIRDLLGLDPLASAGDRDLLIMLTEYLMSLSE